MPSFVKTIEKRINVLVLSIDELLTSYRHHKVAIYACHECWNWDKADPALIETADYLETEAIKMRNYIQDQLDELNMLMEGEPGHYTITESDQMFLKLA